MVCFLLDEQKKYAVRRIVYLSFQIYKMIIIVLHYMKCIRFIIHHKKTNGNKIIIFG
jgi:hypothetical protein